MPDATITPTTQAVPDGGLRFGNDLVTPPATPAVGPTNPTNSAYTVQSNFFGATPTSSVVTSSNSAQNAVDGTKSNISNLPGTVVPGAQNPTGPTGAPTTYTWTDGTTGHLTPDVNGFGTMGYNSGTDASVDGQVTAGNQPLVDRQAQLKVQRDAEIANLTQQFGQDKTTLQTTQDNETGGSTRNLLAMGGYLGNNSFANSYLASLQVSHEQAMQTLQAKYQSAIQAANNAFSDNDFKLAQEMVKNASDIRAAAQKRNDDFLNQTNTILDNQRADAAQKFTEQQAVVKANTDNLTWARTNGLHPGAQFFASGGVIYNSADGSQVQGATPEELQAAGVKPDLSNVQMIQAKRTGVLGELDDYNAGLKEAGKAPLNILQYTQMKQEQAKAVAAAGRSINVAQQQFDLTQQQTDYLRAIHKGWQDGNVIQGNGTVSSKDYKLAKKSFSDKFGADSAKAFDVANSVYVDSSNVGGTGKTSYKDDYGIN